VSSWRASDDENRTGLPYAAAAEELNVLPTVDEAVDWANEELIAKM
jgi:hypothetical protein